MKNNRKKGFTIVELVIVIAVIAILAAVLIPTFTGVINKAKDSKALQEARNLWTQYTVENAETFGDVKEAYVLSNGNVYLVLNGQFYNEKPATYTTGLPTESALKSTEGSAAYEALKGIKDGEKNKVWEGLYVKKST